MNLDFFLHTFEWEVIMMKKYEKPVVVVSDELSEGVYAASGAGCYDVTATINQENQNGRMDYRIIVDAVHNADHVCERQLLTVTFDIPVTYSFSNGTLQGSATGNTIVVAYTYHNNPSDRIRLADLIVTCDKYPQIVNVKLED